MISRLTLLLVARATALRMPCHAAPRSTRCASVRLDATASTTSYIVKELLPAKAGILILTWSKAAGNVRADGFQPNLEAVGDRADQMKQIHAVLPGLASKANVLALCEKGSLSFDTLQEPHASMAKRLSRTKIVGAISAGSGSAVAFVSKWDDHYSIDGCAFNPSFLVAGEDAERALVKHVVAQAQEEGCDDVRLTPGKLQLPGFYASCGFEEVDGAEQLSYKS